MGSVPWRKVCELFQRARELDPQSRDAFLASRCEAHPTLRSEVESLLRAHVQAKGFLQKPLSGLPSHQLEGGLRVLDGEAPSLERVGRYRIERVLGRGGMGDVYLARRVDQPYLGFVALKVASGGHAAPERLLRFERERRVLARLGHPCIARLLDGGTTESGEPYLVMEYVDGEPIDLFVRQQRLDLRELLELYSTICDAVAYAHRNLIVHRDIKPSNILVALDASGRPAAKLLDFGIAKLLDTEDGEPLTRDGGRWLTARYASPEQVRGESVTTASDVYSLGVLLYELLCGRSPYGRVENEFALLQAVCDRDPPRASDVVAASKTVLRRALRDDLDSILATAMRKEPGLRYATAALLAADVRRHLAGRPVSARPDTLAYVARKYVRRNRGLAIALAFLLVSVFVGAVSFAWQAHRAGLQSDRVRRINGFLAGILSWPEPEFDGRNLSLLDAVRRIAGDVDQTFEQEPDVAASLHSRLGLTFHRLGESEAGRRHLERSLLLRRESGDPVAVAESLHRLGELHLDHGDYLLAMEYGREAWELRSRYLGADAPETADTRDLLGLAYLMRGDYEEAEREVRSALKVRRAHGSEMAGQVVLSLNNLGLVLKTRGDLPRARVIFEEGLDLAREALPARHLRVALLLENLGRVLLAQGELEEARQAFQDCLDIRRARLGNLHTDVAVALNALGTTLASLNLQDQAAQAIEESLGIAEVLAQRGAAGGPPDSLLIGGRETLAWLRRLGMDYDGAEELYRELVPVYRSVHGDDHPFVAAGLRNLAGVLLDQGCSQEAITVLEDALRIDRAAGLEGGAIGHDLLLRASAHLLAGTQAAALADAQRSVELLAADAGSPAWQLGQAWTVLAQARLAVGAAEEANAAVHRALSILREVFGDGPNTLLSQAAVVQVACDRENGVRENGLDVVREALQVLEERRGPSHPMTKQARDLLAQLNAATTGMDQ